VESLEPEFQQHLQRGESREPGASRSLLVRHCRGLSIAWRRRADRAPPRVQALAPRHLLAERGRSPRDSRLESEPSPAGLWPLARNSRWCGPAEAHSKPPRHASRAVGV
jgi:hypothetical protein